TTGPARPGYQESGQPGPRRATAPGHPGLARRGRTSFVLALLGLLGGGMVSLLVVNTTLASNSIEITNLKQANAQQLGRVQELRQEVAAGRSAAVIEQEAWRLGMRPDPRMAFLNLRTGSTVVERSPYPIFQVMPGAKR
ncbi:MAG: hypothetical protein ACYCPF_02090, partial [Streptosporangiaceae bacterium]